MKTIFFALAVASVAVPLHAAAPQSPNKMRSAITSQVMLIMADKTILSGEADGKIVTAHIELDRMSGLAKINVMQDGNEMRLPLAAYAGLIGAKSAWIEERGAMTTLVIEGHDAGKDWRIALLFNDDQLRRRRLSREGVKHDMMTFYSRDEDMVASEPEPRKSFGRGYYNY
jgi:hypothetical protein